MISDGMSSGTLAMANQYSLNTLEKQLLDRALSGKQSKPRFDGYSLCQFYSYRSCSSQLSFWWRKTRENGVLNIGINGEMHTPIWQKFKKAGKKTACVTTVTITHATPAGFCINSEKEMRNRRLQKNMHRRDLM